MTRAWSLLTLESAVRQYVGNEGYPDRLESHYAFDTTVPNHAAVKQGDLAVLRDNRFVLGFGWIDQVDQAPGSKRRLRCPTCGRTGFKRRSKMAPAYLCSNCDTAFDVPVVEHLEVTVHVARYGRTFRPLDGVLEVGEMYEAYMSRAVQHAIRELDLGLVVKVLSSKTGISQAFWGTDSGVRPNLSGGVGLRLGKYRIGQQRFRQALLDKFGWNCAITGPQPAAALDAAHLYRFGEKPERDSDAGLLLRRDLHSLFDRWLIAVDPATWRVRVAPQLLEYPHLAELDSKLLKVPSALRPKGDHLEVHYSLSTSNWAPSQEA